jgi:hypothetical protein
MRKSLPKNAELTSSWMDYKPVLQVKTKVLKSLAKRTGTSKPLNLWSLHYRRSASGYRLSVRRTENRMPKTESRFLTVPAESRRSRPDS